MTGLLKINGKKGQQAIEIGILFIIITGALIAMQTYLKRGLQGRLRESLDSIGEQYDFANTIGETTVSHQSNVTSDSSSAQREMVVGGYWDWGGWVNVYRNVTITTIEQETHYDNTSRTGYEIVPNP